MIQYDRLTNYKTSQTYRKVQTKNIKWSFLVSFSPQKL